MNQQTEGKCHKLAPVGILYFSGVGGTMLAAKLLGWFLGPQIVEDVRSIEDPIAAELADRADFLVLCYPTFFLKPAPAMQSFIQKLPVERRRRPVALLTTYELYSGNSNRFAARMLQDIGFRVVASEALRAPGTDVLGVVPDLICPWLYRFERRFPSKLVKLAHRVAELTRMPQVEEQIPIPKWYTPLAWLLQVLLLDGFIRWRNRFKLIDERCSACDQCIRDCPHGAWKRTDAGLEHRGEDCDLCMRCFHRCPGRAIVLVKGLKDNRRLNESLYLSLLQEAQNSIKTSENYLTETKE